MKLAGGHVHVGESSSGLADVAGHGTPNGVAGQVSRLDETGHRDSRGHPGLLEHVGEVLQRQVSAGARCKRAAAQSANAAIDTNAPVDPSGKCSPLSDSR